MSTPQAVLGTLDEVDWAALRHARGPALDTPALLRSLASTDADRRSQAHADLLDTLCHDGTPSGDASAAAFPFMLQLALCPGAPCRVELVELAAGLAAAWPFVFRGRHGRSFWGACSPLEEALGEPGAGGPHQLRTWQVVGDHQPAILQLLPDPDPAIGHHALTMMAVMDQVDAGSVPALQVCADSSESVPVRAAALTACSAASVEGLTEFLTRQLHGAGEDLVRFSAAVGLLLLPGPAPAQAMESALAALAGERDDLVGGYHELPFTFGSLRCFAAVIRRHPEASREAIRQRLDRTRAGPGLRPDVAWALLAAAGVAPIDPDGPGSPDALQREALECVARSAWPAIYGFRPNGLVRVLASLGLPTELQEMDRLLDGALEAP